VQEVSYQNRKKAEISRLRLVNVVQESEARRVTVCVVTVCGATKGQIVEQMRMVIHACNGYSAFVEE
jgi:hypothetical protein